MLENKRERNIKVVQAPAITSHFLQPCDSLKNKTFKLMLLKTKDCTAKRSRINFGDMRVMFMLDAWAHCFITQGIVKHVFFAEMLWLAYFRFLTWEIKMLLSNTVKLI